MFLLDKWYLDVVTDGGDVAILYAARLRWGAFRAAYASAIEDDRAGAHREARTIRGVEPPRRDARELTWRNKALDVDARWEHGARPIRRTLASTPDGKIHWSCHIPRGRASVRIGACTYVGLGYAERLRLTIPPWKLPFGTLRWGRHVSDRHSVVWIEWRGVECRSWVWLDGCDQPDAVVTDTGVSGLADGAELCAGDGRDVVDRRVLAAFTDLLPGFAHRVGEPLRNMHERKRVERSTIVRAGQPVDEGWTLRELVTW
jgi:hypothetical protein